jgi:hypothetical protein
VFLLSVPLIELDPQTEGRCRLSVEFRGGASPVFAGVLVEVENGKVVSCTSRLDGEADATVSGSAMAWLHQMNGGPPGQLETSGDSGLALALPSALRSLPGALAYN